jgi:hypothetical protein
LPDGSAVDGVAARRDVLNLDGDDITAAQLAVDYPVKHGEVARSAFELEPLDFDAFDFPGRGARPGRAPRGSWGA